jgi:hypothetical protein
MKEIRLTGGKIALVDDSDYEWLSQFKWYAMKDTNTFYAVRTIKDANGKQATIRMHREILGLRAGNTKQTDHKDHNGCNNQRFNLRICNNQQNQFNRTPENKSSKFKGVYWQRDRNKWRARIGLGDKMVQLGYFDNEIEAAKAYDNGARKYFGEFADLNFPD